MNWFLPHKGNLFHSDFASQRFAASNEQNFNPKNCSSESQLVFVISSIHME